MRRISLLLATAALLGCGSPTTLTTAQRQAIVDSLTRQVTVRVVPNSGEAFQASYDVAVTRTPASAAITASTASTASTAAPVTRTIPTITLNDPWDGFRRRSVLYMTGTALGVVLATRESGKTSQVAAGALVAGASLAIGLFDAVRTSRKAASAGASPSGAERRPLDLNLGLGSGDAVVMQLRWWY